MLPMRFNSTVNGFKIDKANNGRHKERGGYV